MKNNSFRIISNQWRETDLLAVHMRGHITKRNIFRDTYNSRFLEIVSLSIPPIHISMNKRCSRRKKDTTPCWVNFAAANYYFSCAFLITTLFHLSVSPRGGQPVGLSWEFANTEEDQGRATKSGACAVLGVARRRDGELEGDSASRR